MPQEINPFTYRGLRIETFGEWQIRQMAADSQARAADLESRIELDTKLLQLKHDSLYPPKRPHLFQRIRSWLIRLSKTF